TFTIGFPPECGDHLGLVDNEKNRTLIRTKLGELGYVDLTVKFVTASTPADWVRPVLAPSLPPVEAAPAPTVANPVATAPLAAPSPAPARPAAPSKEDFRNDPLIKQALELFKGQIIE